LGIYYKQKVKKNSDTASIICMSVVLVVLLLLILPFTKPVSTFLYGVFGVAIFFYLTLIFLVALAVKLGRKFYMSVKNIVYLSLSFLFLASLLHSAFFGNVIKSVGGAKLAQMGEILRSVISGKGGLTIGGVIFTLLTYPVISLLGVVGASFTFGVFAVVFVGLTVDYYVNLKSFYDKQRQRRQNYINSESLPSSDTIEGNLAMLGNVADVVPKKLDGAEYESYYNHDIEESSSFDEDSILNQEEVPEEDRAPRFVSGIDFGAIPTASEDNLSDDDLATSKYDPDKFQSPEEYIKYPYVPNIFNSRKENNFDSEIEEETSESVDDESAVDTSEEDSLLGFQNPNSPFVFNSFENKFASNERARRFEEREPRIREDHSDSPFVGYTPSEFTSEESRVNSRRVERTERPEIDIANNSPLNFAPKPSPEQISMPGVRNKPKNYKQEQDDRYKAPPTSLLTARPDDPSKYGSDYEEKSKALENVLSSFKIDAKVTGVTRGPSVTQYELTMPFGISVKRVLQYDGDIAATLRSKKGIRIEAPIAGKNAVGVEVPNDTPSTVGLRELLESAEFKNTKAVLPFAVGKNISGETIIKSLPKMVHMLVAGSTGSGKSVFLHSILLSLMYKCSPSQLRFILIDPKRVEFTIYSGMPHMMLPNAVSNCDKAINALGWAVKEMERRFDTFQTLSVQNIEDYNHCEQVKSGDYQKIPYIVIVIDELNELMMTGKKEVEEKITRLSQLGRASGIHMIIATQRPSADVVTGTIKNNLPTRVAFALQSGIDSRVILDEIGAEKLLGRGDMLMAPYDDNVTSRLQGAFMSMDEVRQVVKYIKDNNESYFDEEVAKEILAEKPAPQEEGGMGSSIAGNLEPDEDELLPAALKLCIDTGGASINMVQRRFRVGYARAARIIDQMELAGYISPGNGSKLRTVYMTLDEYHEKFGEDY